MLQLGNLQLVQSTLLVPILGSFPYRRLEMSVLSTVFGAGWGGGMLTFLLELAHMVVRSINCVLSFSCTQGWYQGYQGWLSHHQTNRWYIHIYSGSNGSHGQITVQTWTAVKSCSGIPRSQPSKRRLGVSGVSGVFGEVVAGFQWRSVKHVKLTRKIHEKSLPYN